MRAMLTARVSSSCHARMCPSVHPSVSVSLCHHHISQSVPTIQSPLSLDFARLVKLGGQQKRPGWRTVLRRNTPTNPQFWRRTVAKEAFAQSAWIGLQGGGKLKLGRAELTFRRVCQQPRQQWTHFHWQCYCEDEMWSGSNVTDDKVRMEFAKRAAKCAVALKIELEICPSLWFLLGRA